MSRHYREAREELEQAIQEICASVDRFDVQAKQYHSIFTDNDLEFLHEASEQLSARVRSLHAQQEAAE